MNSSLRPNPRLELSEDLLQVSSESFMSMAACSDSNTEDASKQGHAGIYTH